MVVMPKKREFVRDVAEEEIFKASVFKEKVDADDMDPQS